MGGGRAHASRATPSSEKKMPTHTHNPHTPRPHPLPAQPTDMVSQSSDLNSFTASDDKGQGGRCFDSMCTTSIALPAEYQGSGQRRVQPGGRLPFLSDRKEYDGSHASERLLVGSTPTVTASGDSIVVATAPTAPPKA